MTKVFSRARTLVRAAQVAGLLALAVPLFASGHKARTARFAPVPAIEVVHYDTTVFGRKYRLDDEKSLGRYIEDLMREIARAKREEPQAKAFEEDPLHHKLPAKYIDKEIRKSMEETLACAEETAKASGEDRDRLLRDLWTMAGAIRESYYRVLPPSMDVFYALTHTREITHPPVGLGKAGPAANLAVANDPDNSDPVLPSSYWSRPNNSGGLDLYYGFGRKELPNLDDVVCTYDRPKQSRGVHGGYEVKCEPYGKVKLKIDEQHSQPFAQRIFWALGFNTTPADCARTVKVKWDPRIITEYNTRQDEVVTVKLFGLFEVARDHLQHDLDPLAPVAEIVMEDEQGRETTLRPNPTWDEFKRKLYRDPSGKPYKKANNIDEAFARRIKFLVYHDVNVRTKSDEGDDARYLGNWDWSSEGRGALRETRGFAFACAWISQFDTPADNNKLYMTRKEGERLFKHCVTDLGGSLGPADDARHMEPDRPNEFPWRFTRAAKRRETGIPLDGSYHTTLKAAPFVNADIHDARWMCGYIAQLTGDQIMQALVGSGMSSARARLFYDKLAARRNRAIADLGLRYPPLKPLDEGETFDYDPRRDGPITIMTGRGEKVSAPDLGEVVVKGRLYTREQVQSGFAARDIARTTRGDRS